MSGITLWLTYQCICFWPVAVFCLCSPFLIVIPVTVLFFFVVCETTRRLKWAHVSVWRSSSITGRGCGRLSSTCSASAAIATLMGMTGRNMSRQSGWLKHLPPKTLLSSRQTHIHSVLWLCSSQILAKPQASYHSSCDAHTLTAVLCGLICKTHILHYFV